MKKTILIIGIALMSISLQAQTIEGKSLDTLSVNYVQLLCIEKALGNNVRVIIDYGGEDVAAISENGKPITFNSSIHAINFVCKHGYEFTFAMPVSGAVPGYRFLLKKTN